jgi:hypothetical protein
LETWKLDNLDLEAWEFKIKHSVKLFQSSRKNNPTTTLDFQELENFATKGHS